MVFLSLKVEDFFSGWVRGQDEKRMEASSVTEMIASGENILAGLGMVF